MSTQVSSGQTYKITNVKAGTVIDLSGEDNKSIIGYPYHSGKNQQWTFNWTGKAWTLRSASSGSYLGIEGTPAGGTRLVAVNDPFEWHIWRDEANENAFRIFVPFTNYNLDLSGYGDTTPGTPVQLWWTWEGLHQTWTIDRP
uniref:Ricin B-like lectin n=1 Tax=Macrolepiota procera TaxID=56183 RepID=F6KMV4_MACPC|nr:ricin B-like lectin [Macrolepiota procera]